MSFRTVNARLRAAIEATARDVKLIARGLRQHPLFAAVTIATLTIGLGAFGVVYTAVDKVLFEPLPYERPDDLYYVWRDWSPRLPNGWLDGTDVSALKASGGAIDGMVGIRRDGRTISDGLDGEPEELSVVASSPELFDLLGVPLALGRGFAADEVGPGRAPVVVLSYDLWQRRFGGDVSVVGSQIQLNGEPFLVIGVTPQSFRFVQPSSWSILGSAQRVDAYITFDVHLDFDDRSVMGLMRAQPGATPAQVAAAVGIVGATIQARDFPAFDLSFYPVGAMRSLVNRVRPVLVVLGAAGVFLVLVLMVNLATVLLARASTREREFAVARALGASGLALTRPTLLEGGLLGILGGAGGALAAVWGTRALVALAPLELPRRDAIAVDGETVAVVIGVGALLGLLASAVPAAWATRTDLGTRLSHAAVRGGGGRGRMRRGLVVVQVALSLVLLSAGGLVAQSFERLLRADPGFEPGGVLTLRVPVPTFRYPDVAATTTLHGRIQSALAALPGVAAVGATSVLPLSGAAAVSSVVFAGAPGTTGDSEHDLPSVDVFTTRPGYFDALGIAILAGRGFDAVPPDGRREVVIDRTLATTFFPDSTPVGRTMRNSGGELTVIGVVEHARLHDVLADGRSQIFVRSDDPERRLAGTLSWALRTDRPPLALGPEVRAAIGSIDPQLAVTNIRSMDRVVSDSLSQQRLSAVLLTGFALTALVLAAMALFGVVSGSVTRRRHEIAVRLALGAEHSQLVRFVLREGALLVLIGLLVGAPGSYLASQVLRGMLVGVSPLDTLTFGVVAVGLTLVALMACYVPARRVAGIDPARTLQAD